MATDSKKNNMLILLAVIVIGAIIFIVLNMPDRRTSGEKIGDAIDSLPQGVGEATEQLEDRTPGERLGDAVEDATDNN